MSIGKLGRGSEGYYLNAVAKGVEDYYLGSREARECQESAEIAVNHQPNICKASTDAELSSISRGLTQKGWGGWDSNPGPRDYESLALTG